MLGKKFSKKNVSTVNVLCNYDPINSHAPCNLSHLQNSNRDKIIIRNWITISREKLCRYTKLLLFRNLKKKYLKHTRNQLNKPIHWYE